MQAFAICLTLSMVLLTIAPTFNVNHTTITCQVREMTELKFPKSQAFIFPYTQKEFDMISAVVMHEVGHCSRQSKIAVTNVILNRLHDGRFGKSIDDVLRKENQFTAINNYYNPTLPPDNSCKQAVIAAMLGEDNSNGALYFCNPSYVNNKQISQWFASLELVCKFDNQYYYK